MTGLMTMQSLRGFGNREAELDFKMASDVSTLYGSHDCWEPSALHSGPRTMTENYMRYPPPTTTSTIRPQSYYANPSTNSNVDALTSYATPSMFTAANAMAQSHNAVTVSPHQTHFEPRGPSPSSYSGSETHMADYTETSPRSQRVSNSSTAQRKDSYSPTTRLSNGGRRRKSESAEVGSARAIYLEKNRKAASKCRNKQKRQQEELVEEARDVERKNKQLKAEVEILNHGIRELMDVVAQHTDCPDSRLKLYVQREADRLAANGGSRTYSNLRQAEAESIRRQQ